MVRVAVTAFRGVPGEFAVEFPGGSSAVLLGDNATGKSTIADALEWYFTGGIDLLRPEGRAHAIRHLGAPEGAPTSVVVETTGSLGGTVILDGPHPHTALEAGRETFLLRGRTLVAFVESTKGDKWRALAELLGLEAVDQLRLDLQRVRNELRAKRDDADAALRDAAQALAPKVTTVSEVGILEAISRLCEQAHIDPPATLEQALDPRWASSVTGTTPGASRATQLSALASELASASGPEWDVTAIEAWNELIDSEAAVDRARLEFLQAADSYIAKTTPTRTCPLCGQDVDPETLVARVRSILEELRGSASQFEEASGRLVELAARLDAAARRDEGFHRRAADLGVELPPPPTSPSADLRQATAERRPAVDTSIAEFGAEWARWREAARELVSGAVEPGSTVREGILVETGTLIEQARTWRRLAGEAERASRAADLAARVFDTYSGRQTQYFAEVLDRISGRVAEIYARLHPSERLEEVCIEPWGSKGVELAVSFHGSRQKPPHGVLSESHLNSLAVALFLAMAETFNERLEFLVLDDVVNSFDNHHRGELASLLASDFSHRQLIVLTHDRLFYERLRRLAPGWSRLEFTSWTFDEGPRTTEYATGGLVEKAAHALDGGDVAGAAMKGRRAVEEFLRELCEGLQAPLPFRRGTANDRREPGELFVGTRRRVRELSKETYEAQGALLTQLEADVAAALNVEAHASQVGASPEEVRAALGRIAELIAAWTCSECGTRVWTQGTPEVCRCGCGRSQFPPAPRA